MKEYFGFKEMNPNNNMDFHLPKGIHEIIMSFKFKPHPITFLIKNKEWFYQLQLRAECLADITDYTDYDYGNESDDTCDLCHEEINYDEIKLCWHCLFGDMKAWHKIERNVGNDCDNCKIERTLTPNDDTPCYKCSHVNDIKY